MPADDFAEYFAEWKSLDRNEQLADPYFGKDGPYIRPQRSGRSVLHHVHLRPVNSPADLLEWDRKTRKRVAKTSDAVLIYAYDPAHGYLLLHSISDPGGHAFSDMSTPESTATMNLLANVAEEFVFWGRVAA